MITYRTYTIRQTPEGYEMDGLNGLGEAKVIKNKDLKYFIALVDSAWGK